MTDTTMHERLAAAEGLTPSEIRVSEYLEDSFPRVAMENLQQISVASDVSMATITRFLRKLGYRDFKDFNARLRAEVAGNFDNPLQRTLRARRSPGVNPRELLHNHIVHAMNLLQHTDEQISAAELEAIAKLTADASRPLYLISSATGNHLLAYFSLLAKYARGDVTLLGPPDGLPHDLIHVPKNAVLLATSFDRHSRVVRRVLEYFQSKGATTLLITNRRSSPLLRFVDHALFIASDTAPVTFKSRVSMLVVLETLVEVMQRAKPAESKAKLVEIESLFVDLSVHVPTE